MLSLSCEPKRGRPAATTPPAPAARPAQPESLESAALLAGGTEVLIRHGAETYRLRVTRLNRLILTK